MILATFKTRSTTFEPTGGKPKHPYWCTHMAADYYAVRSYADSVEEIMRLWPDAYNIRSKNANDYIFDAIFKQPKWHKDLQQ